MRLVFLFLLLSSGLIAQQSLNVEKVGQFHRGDSRYSGSWSYVAPDGSEYALLGAKTGTAIYPIDNLDNIHEIAFIPGPVTNWREITVVGDYAYIATDVQGDDHGMQVIKLAYLPDSVSLVTNYTETFTKGHIIQKDIFSDAPFVYVCGTSATSGIHIMDVSNPYTLFEVGLYAPGYYIHDCHVRGDRIYASAFNEGTIDIIDIGNKAAPTLITRLSIPGGFVHSSSLTMDGKYLIIAAERDGLPARIWNIEDLNAPYEVTTYTANPASLVHNPYVIGDLAIISHNTEGMRVLDIADPTVPVEIGFYDTYDGSSGGFSGLWSACPYFPSGKVIGGNREDGLYVWTIDDIRAGRFYGLVRDSFTEFPIINASIEVIETGATFNSDLEGEFKSGALPGIYTLNISKENYQGKTIQIDLSEGDQNDFVVELAPIVSSSSEIDRDRDTKVTPNPFHQSTTIQFNNLIHANTLLLYDKSGRLVQQYELKGKTNIDISGSNLDAGVYYFQIYDRELKVLSKGRVVKM